MCHHHSDMPKPVLLGFLCTAKCRQVLCTLLLYTLSLNAPSLVSAFLQEKRKRELGQASRGGSYVEEEKRLGRQLGMYSGFD